MNETIESYLALLEQDKRDVVEAAANRLDMLASYVDLLLFQLRCKGPSWLTGSPS